MSLLDVDINDDYLNVLKYTIIQYVVEYGTLGSPLWHFENGYTAKVHNLHKYDLSYDQLHNYILKIIINNKAQIINIHITKIDKLRINSKTILVWNRHDGCDGILTLKDLAEM